MATRWPRYLASVHKAIGVLRQVLAMAVSENRLVANPVDGVDLPAIETVQQRFLTLEHLRTLADAADAHRPLVYMLGTCGLRFGELAELRWGRSRPSEADGPRGAVGDAGRQRVRRRVTENGKARTVSLPAIVAELLAPGDTDALVFPDSESAYMRGTNVQRR